MPVKAKKAARGTSSVRKTGTRWLVAIDPFASEEVKDFWSWVEPIARQAHAQIEAGYVLSPAGMNWNGTFSGPWVKRYAPIADAKLAETLPQTDVLKSVIVCKEAGQRAAAQALVRHAVKTKADCIVIGTHARRGLERLALGSFAETAILLSKKIPVLVFNPANNGARQVRKILVPTDLSADSVKYVNQMANYARTLHAEVVLFHKQPDPLDPLIQQGVYSLGGGWVSVQSYIDEEIETKNQQLAQLEQELGKKDVVVSHVFDTSPNGLVESIEQTAQVCGADMVSVLTRAGPWEAAILGSVARGLVRESRFPILVTH